MSWAAMAAAVYIVEIAGLSLWAVRSAVRAGWWL